MLNPIFDINILDKEIIEWTTSWLKLIEVGSFDIAFKSINHDTYYGWTPELIENVISNYGIVENENGKYKIRYPENLAQNWTEKVVSIDWFDGKRRTSGELTYEVPLNGRWSDLTITFGLEKMKKGLKITLKEIHVF